MTKHSLFEWGLLGVVVAAVSTPLVMIAFSGHVVWAVLIAALIFWRNEPWT